MNKINDLPKEIKFTILTFVPLHNLTSFFLIDKEWFLMDKNNYFWKEISCREHDFIIEMEVEEKKQSERSELNWKKLLKLYLSKKFSRIEFKDVKEGDLFDYEINFIVVGEVNVGKTCFLLRYIDGTYTGDNAESTIGCAFRTVHLKAPNKKKVKLQLWDIAGSERYRRSYFNDVYIRLSRGIFLCFDIANMKSYESLDNILKRVKRVINITGYDVVIMLVGLKSDLKLKRVVSYDDAKLWADSHKMKYFETSAKENINVKKTVHALLFDTLKQKKNNFGKAKTLKKDKTKCSIS